MRFLILVVLAVIAVGVFMIVGNTTPTPAEEPSITDYFICQNDGRNC